MLLNLLRQEGYRITRPRRAVVQALADGPAHITAEGVLRLGRRMHPELSKASVYRTLQLLESLGALRGISSPHGRRYVQVTSGHHHLVCQGCGEVSDFSGCGLCESWRELADERSFQVAGHLLEVFGLCADCRKGA
ncbi:MAG: Fur family transcriptional regulator [Candidatus Bipolaricaulota bacterium]